MAKHHYVPKSYLRGFLADLSRPTLHVHDIPSGRCYAANINDTACERDFYLLDAEAGNDPTAIEAFFQRVEDLGLVGIRAALETGRMPEGEIREQLVFFIAALAMRVPAAIADFEEPFTELLKKVAWHIASGMPDGAKIQRLLDADEIRVEMTQTHRMRLLLDSISTVAKCLIRRNWCLATSVKDAPDFIIADRPVTLSWLDPKSAGGVYGIGFGMSGTLIHCPLSRRVTLLATFEEINPVSTLADEQVDILNTILAHTAESRLYTPTEAVRVLDHNAGLIEGSARVLGALTAARGSR